MKIVHHISLGCSEMSEEPQGMNEQIELELY